MGGPVIQSGPAQPAPTLPALREDLRLYPGPVTPEGAPTWRIHDPVRNRFFEIGWLEFAMLSRWVPNGDPAELIRSVAADTPITPEPDEVEALMKFLVDNHLTKAESKGEMQQLKTKWLSGDKPWYTELLHGYLFFRLPLFKPDALLERTLPYVRFLFTRKFALFLVALAFVDAHLVFRRWDEVTHAFLYFFNFEGLIYYALAATFAKVIHELGHAYSAKHFGLRVPTMGVAFLVMWPVLYTDTGETWKLRQPRQRFAIAAAGMAAELTLALFATLLWAIAAEGAMKSMLFLLATTTWITTLAINLSPFMRFDGYFLLSDALDLPNLHERSGALAKRWMRRTFFGLEQDDPEPTLAPGLKRRLTAFALVTWMYRFVMFLGIAVVVYHAFFKLLGIFLFLVEIVWFILRPIAVELKYLWAQRSQVRVVVHAFIALSLVAGLVVWMFPVATEVEAPAMIHSAREHTVYPPFPARIDAILVRPGETVAADAVLVRLEAPELRDRAIRAAMQARAFAAELSRAPASTLQQERIRVLEQQLNEAVAQYQGAVADMQRLELRAPIGGIVRDLPADMTPGRWVQPRQVMLRVVEPARSVIDAYVAENQLQAVAVGQTVRFYPDVSNLPVVSGVVQQIEPVAIKTVPHPLLSSTNGGPLPASKAEGGNLVPHQAMYRVRIQPATEGAFPSVVRGSVRIETGFFALAENFFARAIALAIRESGF